MNASPAAGRDATAIARELEAQDTHARELALDPRRSIILQAPAGSGKTTILTQRFLRLLAEVDEPEEILAVTFTRKAAAEMRTRVVSALAGQVEVQSDAGLRLAALAAAARARSATRGWDLETNPGRLRIMTIDALNRSLASQLPVAARATVGFALADSPAALHRRAARRTLLDAESEAGLRGDFELLLERLDNDPSRAERLLTMMLGVRAHWLPLILRESAENLPRRIVTSLESIVADRLRAAEALITRPLTERGVSLLRAAATHRAGASPLAPRGERTTLADWRGLAALALTERGEWRRALTKREGIPREDGPLKAEAQEWIAALARIAGAREMLGELAALPDPQLSEEDEATLAALGRLLRLAASELELVFDETGRVDHPYVAAAARRALTEEGEPTDLTLRLGQRLRHILVDEFQDTSSGQVELLRTLTAGWEADDGRSLFLVGDPMQSIYLFREAEVGLFLQAWERGIGGLALEPLVLTRNFRAGCELVDWLNGVFPRVFPASADARASAVRYAPCVAGRAERRGHVELHRIDSSDIAGEARATLDIVRRVRHAAPGCSIAVLVAARPHASAVAAALQAAQMPVAGIDLVPLGAVPVVRDLAALAHAIDHLGDRTAWLAVLRAPWCGLTLRELTALLAGAGDATVWEALNDPERLARLPAGGQARIRRVQPVLADAIEARSRTAPASLLEAAWLRLGGPAACATTQELVHAERFFERLAVWSAEPDWTGAESLDDRLGALFASDAGSAAGAAVQVMTIHRAKGLEFDVVVVPGLGRVRRHDVEPLLRWLELPGASAEPDLLMAPITPRGADSAKPLNRYLKSLQARRLAHERSRLLYVAATRARHELHLICEVAAAAPAAELARPRAGTLLASLWPGIAAQLAATARVPATDTDAEPAEGHTPYRLSDRWHMPDIAYPRPAGPFVVAGEKPLVPDFLWATQSARWAGRVVHEHLRELSKRKVSPDRREILAARGAIARRLQELGLAAEELRRAQGRAIEALLAFVDDPRGSWLFAPEHRDATSPLELTGIVGGRLVNAAVDRSFVAADGTRWLVDIKIGVHGKSGLGAFIDSEVTRYRPGLEEAVALASRLGPEKVRAALFYPLLRVFRAL